MIVREIYQQSREILGKCAQEYVFYRIGEAVSLLSKKGDWDAMLGFVDICGGTDLRTFALPNDVETPLAVNICGRPAYMRNKWHEFHLNGAGSNRETGWTWDDQGLVPTFQDIILPSFLVGVAELKNDLWAELRVFGIDNLNNILRSQAQDGSWADGIIVPLNVMSEFPNGGLTPNPNRYFSRIFTAKDCTELLSATSHDFISGVGVTITTIVAPLPNPLNQTATYYVGVIDSLTIALYATIDDALGQVKPIVLSGYSTATVLQLTDERAIQTQTKFSSLTPLPFIQNSKVSFSATTLPVPILSGETFWINLLDSQDFTIHASESDAQQGINPLFVTTPGSNDLVANASQPITPYTILIFSVGHNFLQGDIVTVANASGNLPNPLLPGTNYYVHYLSSTSITLHTSLVDSITGANAIILTDAGTGVSSVVKLIPATVNTGSVNNINAANHNLSGGNFVQFQSTGALPSPILSGTVYTAQAPLSANTFTLAGTSTTNVLTATRRRNTNTALLTTQAPHGLISGDTIDIAGMGGTGYNQNQVVVTVVDPSAFIYADIGTNEGTIASSTRRRSGEIAVIVTATPHGLTTGDFVNIQGLGGSAYNLPYIAVTVIDTVTFWYNDIGLNDAGVATSSRARTTNVATIVTLAAHGLSTGMKVTIEGLVDSSFNNVNATVTVVDSVTFTYPNTGVNVATTSDANGFVATPITDANGLIAKGVVDTGGVITTNRINITDVGTGVLNLVISRAFTIAFNENWFTNATSLPTGTPFKINSPDGTLPTTNPTLNPLTTYYIRQLDNFTVEFFETSAKASDTTIRLGATRSRTTNVATVVTQAAHGFATNDYVDIAFSTDATFNSQHAQITVTNATAFTYANTAGNVGSTADTSLQVTRSPIQVIALGTGETDLILSAPVTVTLLSNLMEIDNPSYLNDNTPFEFITDGTLPSPLAINTTYELSIVNGLIQIKDNTGTLVTLTDIGSGNHHILRSVNFQIAIPTSVQCLANEYDNGISVQVLNQIIPPATTSASPTPLVDGAIYYIRRIDDENVELYLTPEQAIDLTSTSGRVLLLDQGSGLQTFFQILPNIAVKRIDRVLITPEQSPSQKTIPNTTPSGIQPPPLRNGFIDLFAWDYGRTNAVTLIGHYPPQENEPQYRRIKTLMTSAWIRMRYRRKTYKVQSLEDYIPLDSAPAILYMIRAQELYRTNFTDEGAKYETLAEKYMLEDNRSRQGPESPVIQFNSPVYQNPDAAWMQ